MHHVESLVDWWEVFVLVFKAVALVTAALAGYLAHLVYRDPRSARVAAGIPTLLNIYIVCAYSLLLLELSPLESDLSDYGAPFSFMSMIIVVPAVMLATFLIVRNDSLDENQKRYLKWSRIFWVLQFVPSLQFIFFVFAWASGR